MNTYLRILRLIYPYKHHFGFAVVCMMVFALSNGAMIYLIGPVMKFLFTTPKDLMILAVPIVIIAVAVVKGFSSFGQSFFMGFVSEGVIRDIRKRLYDHVLNMPVKFFSSTPTGVLVSRLTNDVNLLQTTTADAVTTVLKQSLTILVLAGVLITLDWKLSLAASVVLPLAFYPMRRFGKKMKNVSTKGQVTMGTMTSLLHEAIVGIRIVKAFCM